MFDNKESIYRGYDSFYNSTNRIYQNRSTKFKNKNSKVVNSVNEDPKGSEFYDKIKYLLIPLVIVGAIPVCKPGKGLKTRQFLIFVYCVLVYGTLSCLFWFEIRRVYQEMKKILSLEYGVQIINRLLFLTQHFWILVLVWPRSIHLIRNLRQWSEFQNQYERVTQQPFKLTKINKYLKFTFTNLCVLMPMSWVYYRGLKGRLKPGFWQTLLYCYMALTSVNLIQLWYFSARVGEIVTQDFFQQLKQRFKKSASPSELQDYRLLWLKLSETVCDAGAIFSFSIAEIIIVSFINVIRYSYITVSYLISAIVYTNERNFGILIKSLFSQVFTSCIVFLVCRKGYTVSQQNQAIKRHLLDMKIPNTLLKKDGIAELRILIRSVNIFPVQFSINGFKTINTAMLISILGNLVTYVIILVQFNLSLPSSVSSSLGSTSSLASSGQLELT